MKKRFRLTPLKIICLLLTTGAVTVLANPYKGGTSKKSEGLVSDAQQQNDSITTNGADSIDYKGEQMAEESKAAFLEAYKVFMHPRCMNCHPAGDAPLQGDDSHIHLQNVTRGPDGKGLYAMKCKNCHQDQNIAGEDMPPGAPTWQMPPANRRMVFQGMSPHDLARHFKENNFTGFKTMNDMIKHVESEALVLRSFLPLKNRATIPMSHDDFVAKVKEWIAKGAVIPD